MCSDVCGLRKPRRIASSSGNRESRAWSGFRPCIAYVPSAPRPGEMECRLLLLKRQEIRNLSAVAGKGNECEGG